MYILPFLKISDFIVEKSIFWPFGLLQFIFILSQRKRRLAGADDSARAGVLRKSPKRTDVEEAGEV